MEGGLERLNCGRGVFPSKDLKMCCQFQVVANIASPKQQEGAVSKTNLFTMTSDLHAHFVTAQNENSRQISNFIL